MGRVLKVKKTEWKEQLEHFLVYKMAQGTAVRTLDDYRYHVRLFFETTKTSFEDYDNIKMAVLRYFAESSSLAPATFNTRRKTLKAFFAWAVSEGIVPDNPMMAIKKRKEDEKPRSVGEETVRNLLCSVDRSTFVGLRDYALLILTMDTGIRPMEAFGLRVEDFNYKAFEIIILAEIAKTRISRSLPISPYTVEAIRKLISARHDAWRDDVPLFCTEFGTSLNRFTWGRRLRKYSKLLGVKVTPYDLRHTFAIMFLRNGGNAFSLQRTLGHTNIAMTKRYVAVTQEDLVQQHTLATPLNTIIHRKSVVRKVK